MASRGQCPSLGLPPPGCLSPFVEARAAAWVRVPCPRVRLLWLLCGLARAAEHNHNSAQSWSVRAERLCCQRWGPAGSQGRARTPQTRSWQTGPRHPGILQPGCSLRLCYFFFFDKRTPRHPPLRSLNEYTVAHSAACFPLGTLPLGLEAH